MLVITIGHHAVLNGLIRSYTFFGNRVNMSGRGITCTNNLNINRVMLDKSLIV